MSEPRTLEAARGLVFGGHIDGDALHVYIALVASMIQAKRSNVGRLLTLDEHAAIQRAATIEAYLYAVASCEERPADARTILNAIDSLRAP